MRQYVQDRAGFINPMMHIRLYTVLFVPLREI